MRYIHVLSLMMAAMAISGCTKDYHLGIDPNGAKIIIEGRITNLRGPYMVRITKSIPGFNSTNDSVDLISGIEVVKNAKVIISDDQGVADTLIPAPDTSYAYLYTFQQGVPDSMYQRNSYQRFSYKYGYYQTTKITGMPGHTYHLEVTVDNKKYTASAYMPSAPPIDSVFISEKAKQEVLYHGLTIFVPSISFREPRPEKNYYLIKYDEASYFPYDAPLNQYNADIYNANLTLYIVDDQTLPEFVNRMPLPEYASWQGVLLQKGSACQVRLYSITKESYDYFNAFKKQLKYDGNVYQPSPATMPTNIEGGALGYFWAAGASVKLYIAP